MTKRNTWLLALLIVLVAVYVFAFTNWFKKKTIIISETSRPMQHFRGRKDMPNIMFGLSGEYRLTEVKVVPIAQFQSNPNTPSMWHLISDSNSAPIQHFVYGQHIRGMRPQFKNEETQGLETNVEYRMFITAGWVKGSLDFQIK